MPAYEFNWIRKTKELRHSACFSLGRLLRQGEQVIDFFRLGDISPDLATPDEEFEVGIATIRWSGKD